jgi:hypothetical protein
VPGRSVYTYVGNDPLDGTDPTGEADEQIEEIVVQAARPPPPPPPPPPSLAAITVVGTRPLPIRIPIPAISAASATVGVGVFGLLFPSSLGSDDTCDNGNCDDDDSEKSAEKDPGSTTMDSRRTYEPSKPGRKKQGREGGNKNRGKKGFKQRNPLREPPKHTPSQKD